MSKVDQHIPQPKQKQAINSVDERLLQISRDILPSAPYQLRVDKEIILDKREALEWRRGCPFEPHEERLQYLTFRSNFDKDTIFRAEGNWDDGNGNIMSKIDKTSGPSTPLSGQTAKRKITLSDYKNKASGHGGAAQAPSKTNGEVKHSTLISSGGSRPPLQHEPRTLPKEQPHGVKRSFDTDKGSDNKKNEHTPDLPPSKKARLPPNPTAALENGKAEKVTMWELPPMLSPTLPPDIEEELTKLKAREDSNGRRASKSTAKAAPEKGPALSSKESPRLAKSASKEPSQKNGRLEKLSPYVKATKPSQNTSTDSISEKRTSAATAKGVATSNPPERQPTVREQKTVPPIARPPNHTSQKLEKKRLLVKLKIPKSIRKNCMRILQMQPRPQKRSDSDFPRRDDSILSNGKPHDRALSNGTSQDVELLNRTSDLPQGKGTPAKDRNDGKLDSQEGGIKTPRSGEKRKRIHDQATTSEPATKRQKPPAGLDLSEKPRTPVRPTLRSPLVTQHNSASRSRLATPKRSLKSTAMQRIGSSEGDVMTPLGASRGNTPVPNSTLDRVNRDGRSPSNISSGGPAPARSDDIPGLRTEQRNFENLGRTLKHEAKALLPDDGDFKNDTPEMRQGAAIAFEAVVAFLLAFTMGAEINRISRQPSDATGWRSLLPFLHYVERVTRIYRPLLGFTHQLEALCRQSISSCDDERLERIAALANTLEDQRPATADSGATNISSSTNGKGKAKQEYADMSKFAENRILARKALRQGYRELSIHDLQRSFPATWGKSANSSGMEISREEISPINYADGPYYFPLSLATSEIEGARAAWQFLKEWCGKHEVNWEGKLGL